jgi:hypothetical protein
MDYQRFRSLEAVEAEQLLTTYLEIGQSNAAAMAAFASTAGVHADFSISSVPTVLGWLHGMLRTMEREVDPRLPEWIRSSSTYREGLFDFDEPSKALVLQASYYLGESFVRSFNRLRWSVGAKDFVQENMPVVAGFSDDAEMPTLIVSNNLFRRAIADSSRTSDFEAAVGFWRSKADQAA